MTAPTDLDRLSAGKYLSLTTFRRDGTPVATPVWVTREQDHLYVYTDADSGKAKRVRSREDVLLAPCDARGTVLGPHSRGRARLLDEAGTQAVRRRVLARYGLAGRAFLGAERVRQRGRPAAAVGIEITPTPAGQD